MIFNRVCKGIITIILIAVMTMCFTFNAFAMDMPIVANNPQIVIDGKDTEIAWLSGNRVSFDVSPNIAKTASVEVLNYKNTVYGLINLIGVVERETDLIVRLDFYHQNKNGYVAFLIKGQSTSYGDSEFNVEGIADVNAVGYCVEFSFSTKSTSFKQGDLVKLEISYGSVEDVDNPDLVQGFSEKIVYDYYIGGELPENIPESSSGKTKKPSSNTTKTTTKSSAVTDNSTSFNVNEFVNYGYSDARETTVIITVMTAACIVSLIVMCTHRKTNENHKPDYTDDDKGCD